MLTAHVLLQIITFVLITFIFILSPFSPYFIRSVFYSRLCFLPRSQFRKQNAAYSIANLLCIRTFMNCWQVAVSLPNFLEIHDFLAYPNVTPLLLSSAFNTVHQPIGSIRLLETFFFYPRGQSSALLLLSLTHLLKEPFGFQVETLSFKKTVALQRQAYSW